MAAGAGLSVPDAGDPAFDPIVAEHTVFDPVARSSGEEFRRRLTDPVTVVGRDMLKQARKHGPLVGGAGRAGRPITHHGLKVLRRCDLSGLHVELGVGQLPFVGGQAQSRLALTQRSLAPAQRHLHLFSISDVQVDAGHAQRRPIIGDFHPPQFAHPSRLSRREQDPIFYSVVGK